MWALQSTAATLIVGPILDSTGAEFTTAVIGDLSISKNGGTLTAMAAAATLTHIANGQYTLVMTTGNLDTLGRAQITCNRSTYQMPPVNLMVTTANVYNSLVLGSDVLDVSATQLAGQTITAGAGVTFPSSVASPTNITAATGVVLSGVTHTGAVIPTVTTLTGHTAQTADHTAGIADIPTVAEFNARTLAAASYFDASTDTVLLGDGMHGGSSATFTLAYMLVQNPNGDAVTFQSTGFGGSGLHLKSDLVTGPGAPGVPLQFDTADADLATLTALATAQADLDTITGSDGVTLATAQGLYAPAKAADILTTALTESYAADGADPTLTQAVYLVMQHLSESSISGTTKTVKKLDGSTSAATFTLDDATTPTSITRAT